MIIGDNILAPICLYKKKWDDSVKAISVSIISELEYNFGDFWEGAYDSKWYLCAP